MRPWVYLAYAVGPTGLSWRSIAVSGIPVSLVMCFIIMHMAYQIIFYDNETMLCISSQLHV